MNLSLHRNMNVMMQKTYDLDTEKNRKIVELEFIRILAIFLVIFNHSGKTGFFLFSQEIQGSFSFWIYLTASIFCVCGVPLFFMVSGALLLEREESLEVLWKKRICKFALLLVIWSFIYYIDTIQRNSAAFDLGGFLKILYSSNTRVHLWYMYAYLSYLCTLPFLRSLVRTLEVKYYWYLIGLSLILSGIIPVLQYYIFKGQITINRNLGISWLVSNSVLYPCIGYFIHKKLNILKFSKYLLQIWIANIFGIIISCYMTYYKGLIMGTLNEQESQTFHGCFVILNSLCIFITIKYIWIKFKIPIVLDKIIISMGKCTMGIYLLHLIVRDRIVKWGLLTWMISMGVNSMVAVIVQCLEILVISYIFTLVLGRIPVIKVIVGK